MIVTDFAEGDHPPALPATRTLERFLTVATAAIPLRGLVTVLITSDRGIRKLNRQFRQKNKATDVLSFPAAVPSHGGRGTAKVAGDLAISIDMAARQALVLGHPLLAELKVLMLHGLLHLAGFDHEADKGEMAFRELELRRKLRLPGGLIERSTAAPSSVKSRTVPGTKAITKPISRTVKKTAGRKVVRL
jgi:probable rRNA maturation factor